MIPYVPASFGSYLGRLSNLQPIWKVTVKEIKSSALVVRDPLHKVGLEEIKPSLAWLGKGLGRGWLLGRSLPFPEAAWWGPFGLPFRQLGNRRNFIWLVELGEFSLNSPIPPTSQNSVGLVKGS
jgi:hypothetical protein